MNESHYFRNLHVGQFVTFLVPNGIGRKGVEWKQKRAKVIMRFAGHVLCGGSWRGNVVDDKNFVKAGKIPIDKR